MEIVKFKTRVIDNMVEIIPEDGFLDNSIYEIRLKGVLSESGDEIIKTIKLCTKLTPLFVDIQAVKSIVDEVAIPDEVILYHIREASRFAEYIQGTEINEDKVPFEVSQFVKYKAAHECILRHMVSLASATGVSGKVGSVTFAEKETTKDISKLLEHLSKEVAKWTDDVKGFKMEGRALMQSTIKSSGYSNSPGYQSAGVNLKRGI